MDERLLTVRRELVSATGWVGGQMRSTDGQYERIAPLLRVPHGKLTVPWRYVMDGLLPLAKERCAWHWLPPSFGPWHEIVVRLGGQVARGHGGTQVRARRLGWLQVERQLSNCGVG